MAKNNSKLKTQNSKPPPLFDPIERFRKQALSDYGVDLSLLNDKEVRALIQGFQVIGKAGGYNVDTMLKENAAVIKAEGLATFFHIVLNQAANLLIQQAEAEERSLARNSPSLALPNGQMRIIRKEVTMDKPQ